MNNRSIVPVLSAGVYTARVTALNDIPDFVSNDGTVFTTNVEVLLNVKVGDKSIPQTMRIVDAFVEQTPANGGNPYLRFNSFFANRIQRQAKLTFADTAELEAWVLANDIEIEVAIDSRGFTQLNVVNPKPPVTPASAPVDTAVSVEGFTLSEEE